MLFGNIKVLAPNVTKGTSGVIYCRRDGLSLISKNLTHCQLITVARDRDSDSERLLYFGRVIFLFMVALCNRETIYIFILFLSSFFLSFFSSPNLSGRRLDVYHTLAHGVALVRI